VKVRIHSGLAYEALLALEVAHGAAPAGRFAHGAALMRRYNRLPDSLRRQLASVDAGLGVGWADLLGLVQTAVPPHGVPELVERLKELSPLELKLSLLGYHDRTFRAGIGAALLKEAAAGDRRARSRFKARAPQVREGLEVGPLVDLPPDEVAARAIDGLASLPPEIYVVDRKAPQVLARAAAQAAGLVRTLPAQAVITRLTRGIEPGRWADVLLVPTAVHRPWTEITDYERTKILCFPVSVADPSKGEPDPDLVALYRALGDATRLRLLKRLAEGRASFGQLSHELGLARSTLHQHALILRTAGLVRLHLDSGLELNPDRPALDRSLEEFLGSRS